MCFIRQREGKEREKEKRRNALFHLTLFYFFPVFYGTEVLVLCVFFYRGKKKSVKRRKRNETSKVYNRSID